MQWSAGVRATVGDGRFRAALAAIVLAAVAPIAVARSAPAGAQTGDDDTDSGAETMVVATKPLPPFVFVDEGELRGFSIDYWNEVASRIGVETEWLQQETVEDIIVSAEEGRADAAIAGISITADREARIDFSQPYYISGHQIVTRSEGDGDVFRTLARLVGSRSFLGPFAALILLVVVVSHLVWFFERGHDSDDFPYDYRTGIGEAVWWSTVSVITGGEAVKNINTTLSRLIAVMWMLVGLFLLAFITARATTVLTVAQLQSDVEGLDDLAGTSVTTVEGTATVAFLRDEAGVIARQAPDLPTALDELAAGDTDAVVFDAPVVAYEVTIRPGNELELVQPIIGRDPYGIALPPGSDRLEAVNTAVIEIGRDGTLDELLERWFGST